jgi:signal transduction histidine kinase
MHHGGLLDIQIGKSMGTAVLRFTDTGCGMDKETLDNIFEPFFTQNKAGRGTGLGLTICHCIIQDHGGTIEAQSPGAGKGSTFMVRLPLMETGAPSVPGNNPSQKGAILGFPGVNPFRDLEMGSSRRAA